MTSNMIGIQGVVCPGDDDDRVFTGALPQDIRRSGPRRDPLHLRRVDSRPCEVVDRSCAVSVIAYRADEVRASSQAGGGNSLIRALTAPRLCESAHGDRLTGRGRRSTSSSTSALSEPTTITVGPATVTGVGGHGSRARSPKMSRRAGPESTPTASRNRAYGSQALEWSMMVAPRLSSSRVMTSTWTACHSSSSGLTTGGHRS